MTEHWNPHAHIRQDLFGFIDAIALRCPTGGKVFLGVEVFSVPGITAIQCVNTHLPEHIQKIRESKAALAWVLAGGKIVIHNWKLRVRNGRKVWLLEEINVDPRVP